MEVIFDMPLKVPHCFSLIRFYFSVNQVFKGIIDWPNISFSLCYLLNATFDIITLCVFRYLYTHMRILLFSYILLFFKRTQKAL